MTMLNFAQLLLSLRCRFVRVQFRDCVRMVFDICCACNNRGHHVKIFGVDQICHNSGIGDKQKPLCDVYKIQKSAEKDFAHPCVDFFL